MVNIRGLRALPQSTVHWLNASRIGVRSRPDREKERLVNRWRNKEIAQAVGALVLVGVILWIDFTTGVWNELVIMAGLAAGLVSFLLTVTVLNRIVVRSNERRWAPVHRLALSEFTHAIADEDRSEISRGKIVARTLPVIVADADPKDLAFSLQELRRQVIREREQLSDVLSRWAEFLVSSGDYEDTLRHIADIAWMLDKVRDVSVDVEESISETSIEVLNSEVTSCNEGIWALEERAPSPNIPGL